MNDSMIGVKASEEVCIVGGMTERLSGVRRSANKRCVLAAIILSQLLTSIVVRAQADNSNWMGNLWPQIAKKPLKEIAIPGTHDSAMYEGMADGDVSKNQVTDFTGQLNAGARYFDLRLGYFTVSGLTVTLKNTGDVYKCWEWNRPKEDGFYMYGHSTVCTNIKVAAALDQIRLFLDKHKKEIVILNVTAFVGRDKASDFVNLIQEHLGHYIFRSDPVGGGLKLKLQDLTPSGLIQWEDGRVVLLYDHGMDEPPKSVMWRQDDTSKTPFTYERISIGWYDDTGLCASVGELGFINNELKRVQPSGAIIPFLVIIAATTPSGTCLRSPIDGAKDFNPRLAEAIKGWSRNYRLNIVEVDDISCCGIAQAIIDLNKPTR
jgi:hypothetical protein